MATIDSDPAPNAATAAAAGAPHPPTNSTGVDSPARTYIKDFLPSQRISGAFSIGNAQIGRTRQDKTFLKCLIGDRTGSLAARMWSIELSHFRRLPTDGFVYVEGETQPFQGELQIILQVVEPIDPTPDEIKDLMPVSERDPEEMFRELSGLIDTLKHPAARALAQVYLADQHLMSAFKACPAAKTMHHAYLGGLLEHTLSLMNLADRICPLYPKLNRDVVLLGLFLHDLGKTRELVYDRTFGYTDRGELIGHIVDGAIMLHDKAHQVMMHTGMRLPRNFIMVLQHIIISHHHQPQFGAAKFPATPEALLVAMLDNLDAKTTMALAAARPNGSTGVDMGGNFTDKQWALDNAKLFRPDPLA